MGTAFSCLEARPATGVGDRNDSDDVTFDPRRKGYNPYGVEIARMGDTGPAPKSNILLPLYIYPNPDAWKPLQQM